MIGPTSFVNLLTYFLGYRMRFAWYIADDGLVSMVWCKHGFWRRRLHFNGKSVGFPAKKLIKEFLNKGWKLLGTKQTFEKLQETARHKTKWQC